MSGPDVVIAGGGIIGCACAYVLAGEGVQVTLLERERVGAHASGGAAGILSSRDDEPGSPFDRLNRASLELHPRYAEALRDETGIDVEYQREGVLTLLRSNEMRHAPRFDETVLSRTELQELEPHVGPGWAGAIFHRDDGQVNAGRLTTALAEGAVRRGARIEEGRIVTGLLASAGRARGVRTADGDVAADRVVLAAGPWSGTLGDAIGVRLPIVPVKGEIVWARARPRLLHRPVFAGCYLVPKPEEGIAIGATHVHAGFDESPSIGGMAQLLAVALEAVPALAGARFQRAWSSVRPASTDGLPVLGPVPGIEGLTVATGHYAYGIALSLITAELVRNWVLGREQPLDTSPFRTGPVCLGHRRVAAPVTLSPAAGTVLVGRMVRREGGVPASANQPSKSGVRAAPGPRGGRHPAGTPGRPRRAHAGCVPDPPQWAYVIATTHRSLVSLTDPAASSPAGTAGCPLGDCALRRGSRPTGRGRGLRVSGFHTTPGL